jgi:hypothetical protein
VSYLVAANPALQGDLRIYRAAAQADALGRNPYEPGALTGPGGKTQSLPFVYPPVALPLLRALLVFDYRTTYFLFFALKMAAVVALIALWRRWLFPDDLSGACLYLLCALAYGQTLKMDVRAGNISVFEQVLIWTAVLAFRRGGPGSTRASSRPQRCSSSPRPASSWCSCSTGAGGRWVRCLGHSPGWRSCMASRLPCGPTCLQPSCETRLRWTTGEGQIRRRWL